MNDVHTTTTNPFPTDWTVWNAEWKEWKARHAKFLLRTSLRAPGKNFLADDVLGTWGLASLERAVELSEVTMPDFGKGYGADRVRFVGITWVNADGTTESGGVVGTFDDLDRALGFPPYN